MEREESTDEPIGSMWMVAVAGLVVAAGCASLGGDQLDDAQQEAYLEALEREIRGHTYEMRCRALLPLAEEMLWEVDRYDEVEYRRGRSGLNTEWLDGERSRVRHEVRTRDVGLDRCSVQIVRRQEGAGSVRRVRDIGMELRLLETVDAAEAERVRTEALREARRQLRE